MNESKGCRAKEVDKTCPKGHEIIEANRCNKNEAAQSYVVVWPKLNLCQK